MAKMRGHAWLHERHFFVQQGNRRCAPETWKQAKLTFPCSTNQANDPLNLVHDHFKKEHLRTSLSTGNQKKWSCPQKAQIQIALLDTPVTQEEQSHPKPQEIVCFDPNEIRETNVKFSTHCCLSSQLRYVHQASVICFILFWCRDNVLPVMPRR